MIRMWLGRVVVAIFVLAGLYTSAQNLLSTQDLGSANDDPVADWAQRFVKLKAALPFERGLVGYISDADVPGISFNAPNDEGEYVLTQYAMAPVIIRRGTVQTWNVANLSGPAYAAWSEDHAADFEITRFGSGIYLLHRVAP